MTGVLIASACLSGRAASAQNVSLAEVPRLTVPTSPVPVSGFALTLPAASLLPVLSGLPAWNPASFQAPLLAHPDDGKLLTNKIASERGLPVQLANVNALMHDSGPAASGSSSDAQIAEKSAKLGEIFGENIVARPGLLSFLNAFPVEEASAAGKRDKTMDSSLRLAKDVKPDQMIKILSLLLPDDARLELEDPETILLSFYGRRSRKKLFTYAIKRDRKPDFGGSSLPALVQDLAGATAARYRGLENDERSLFKKINQIVSATGTAAISRHAKDRNYSVLVRDLHTTEQSDWY